MSTLIWRCVRQFVKMDAKDAPEHILGGFTILLILDTSKPSGNDGYSWNLGGMFN